MTVTDRGLGRNVKNGMREGLGKGRSLGKRQ